MIGDSCGSYQEDSEDILSEEVLQECLSMPGGGPHKVGPGQVTDDSEMMLCQMLGLIQGNEELKATYPDGVLSVKHILGYYKKWYASKPFGIKQTIQEVMKYHVKGLQPYQAASTMKHSVSNSSLMRIMPLAVWSSTLFEQPIEVYDALIADSELTHANRLVTSAIFIYGIAVNYLLNFVDDPNRAKGAFDHAMKLTETIQGNYEDPETHEDCEHWLFVSESLASRYEFEEWGKSEDLEAQMIDDRVGCTDDFKGWIKKAFILAFYFLLKY